jgi:hypothetical protein
VLRPRFVPLALLVTVLVAVVALVARGRPLGSGPGRSGGLPLSFWDYVYTTTVIVAVPILMLVGIAALFLRRRSGKRRTTREYILHFAVFVAVMLLLELVFVHYLHLRIHGHLQGREPVNTGPLGETNPLTGPHRGRPQALHFRWGELAIVLALLFVLAVAAAILARRSRPPRRRLELAPEVLAAALDESLDDLRADPDLRRAIVAAYARMETALAAAGLPRLPAEAPLEYVERALLTLDASAAAVRRLTDLFEWARFSQHEPEPSMRDDAVDALVAVRDELRASELTPA